MTDAAEDPRLAQARARFARVPFARWLGVAVGELGPDRAVLVLPHRPEHLNAGGVLSGGASASLVTMAGALAAWTGMDLEAEPRLSCVDLSVQYLARASAEDIVAEAGVLRRGRDVIILEVMLRSPARARICQGLLSYHATPSGRHAPRVRAEHALLPPLASLTRPGEQRLFRGYVQQLAITPLHQSPGRVRVHMPCTAMHVDERGHLHAGALASIVDIAAVAASWSLVPRRDGARGSTIGMQVSYPGAAAEAVVADAHVQQRSEDLLFSTVHVTTAISGRLIAMGQVTYRLLEPRPDSGPGEPAGV
jgi:uncharacterized protein (TIGR00369 family)